MTIKPKYLSNRSWKVHSTMKDVRNVCQELMDEVLSCGLTEDDSFGIHLALEEALTNAVKHGNQSDPEKMVIVDCLISPEKFDISITDEGTGFNPDGLPDPRLSDNLFKCCGRGVLLIKSYMDTVEFNDRGNCVHMIKFRK